MLKIEFYGPFKKDYKTAIKRGHSPERLTEVLQLLAAEQPLPPRCRDHRLTSSKQYKHVRECHILPDWLLIYQILPEQNTLRLIRTGSHADLFQ